MTSSAARHTSRPATLSVAVALVALEALALIVLAVLELSSLSVGRLTMGVTTAVFFLVYAGALLLCAYGLLRLVSWARSPVVLAQLIQLGLAWNWRDTPAVAVPLGVFAAAILAALFAPASLAALEPHDEDD
ncbi:hypothetical protein [Nocardioides sp. CER19]|uniref:hypothetical protein n=1 Tax=Nocardioides sp. CER19 TaxID=3038538 RepID=UPI002449008E|nr:hypothetical protein [Nocardioides sp. CER19]MDH2415341.1 hypothetical protein [Nocardioides sp. CER19]